MAKVTFGGPPKIQAGETSGKGKKKARFQMPDYGFPELGYQAGPGGKQVPYGQSPRYANPTRWTPEQEKWQNQHVGWKAKVRYRVQQAGLG